jgi:hypothetical protein
MLPQTRRICHRLRSDELRLGLHPITPTAGVLGTPACGTVESRAGQARLLSLSMGPKGPSRTARCGPSDRVFMIAEPDPPSRQALPL